MANLNIASNIIIYIVMFYLLNISILKELKIPSGVKAKEEKLLGPDFR